MISFNFSDSLSRIDERLNTDANGQPSLTIPRFDEISYHFAGKVLGAVLSIKYSIQDKELSDLSSTEEASLTCFVAEVCEILRANASCRDIIVGDERIQSVFSTSLKKELDELIDDIARVRSIAMVVEKKAGLRAKHSFCPLR